MLFRSLNPHFGAVGVPFMKIMTADVLMMFLRRVSRDIGAVTAVEALVLDVGVPVVTEFVSDKLISLCTAEVISAISICPSSFWYISPDSLTRTIVGTTVTPYRSVKSDELSASMLPKERPVEVEAANAGRIPSFSPTASSCQSAQNNKTTLEFDGGGEEEVYSIIDDIVRITTGSRVVINDMSPVSFLDLLG